MPRGSRSRGEVEIDDTWIGGSRLASSGSRQLKGRRAALVLVAVEKRGRPLGSHPHGRPS